MKSRIYSSYIIIITVAGVADAMETQAGRVSVYTILTLWSRNIPVLTPGAPLINMV